MLTSAAFSRLVGEARAATRTLDGRLQPRDRVRLREDYLDLSRGAVGVVIGFYRTERGVRTVPCDRLEPLGEDE